jgi:hypothetical protein
MPSMLTLSCWFLLSSAFPFPHWPQRVRVEPERLRRGRTAAVCITGFEEQPVELRILNYCGQTVLATRLLPERYMHRHTLNVPVQLGPGNYLVLLQAEDRPWQARTWLTIK